MINAIMTSVTAACAVVVTGVLLIILGYIAFQGFSSISLEFLTDTPKPVGEGGGIGNAIVGSAMMTLLAALIGLPVGIAAGVYLAEFGKNWYGNTIRFIADTLIGVPSIIIGIFIYTYCVTDGKAIGLAVVSLWLSL